MATMTIIERSLGNSKFFFQQSSHAPRRRVQWILSGRWVFSSSRRTQFFSKLGRSVIQQVSSSFFSLLFPDTCRICQTPLGGFTRVPVCGECLVRPEPLRPAFFCVTCRTPFQNRFPLDAQGRCALCRSGLRGFDAAYCYGAYEGTLRDLIHLFKYGRMRPLAPLLGRYLGEALPADFAFDVVVPMPLHWRRRWQRGFNQAELLARVLARGRGIPIAPAVRRSRATR